MGRRSGVICRECGTRFDVDEGGGFFFDLLHCDTCGGTCSVGHQELGDIHLRYVKGLPGPYAVARSKMDRQIQQEYGGKPLTRAEYHAAAEATLEPCTCGGSYRYDARPRCPGCRSTQEHWDVDPDGVMVMYD